MSNQPYNILVINPGSTSTKVALYADLKERSSRSFSHSSDELRPYHTIADQTTFRAKIVERFVAESLPSGGLDAIAARGGLLRPIPSGVYSVNEKMVAELRAATYGEHASNLGGIIAAELAGHHGCPAYIADPVVVDELADVARYSGLPEIKRISIFHALNQKSAARKAAAGRGLRYEDGNLIVAHLGGGVSVGAHDHGRVVDVNNALNGDGPFSPERSGSLPAWPLVELALRLSDDPCRLKKMITGRGGLTAYCGTNNLEEIERRIAAGDEAAAAAFEAMAYQISKEIAMHGATLRGRVDLIVLTGGMAYDPRLVDAISGRVSFLAPIVVIPGEGEMNSLAENVCAVLSGARVASEY